MSKIPCLLAVTFAVIAITSLAGVAQGHRYKTGDCPVVEPMSDFSMKKFLGIWYVIQKTNTASSCVIYNITKNQETADEYFIEQISQKAPLSITPIKHEYSYTGKLTVTDRDVPARMTVQFPLSVAGSSKFVVFMSDYDNYAGVFTCQKIPISHRQSATILSRTRDLDKIYVDKIRSRLASFSVDPFDLSIVNQTGCPKEGEAGWNIHIDPDTFSTRNIANLFRKAGGAIGDGFETVVSAGKKLYQKVRGTASEEVIAEVESYDESSTDRSERLVNMAEWLP